MFISLKDLEVKRQEFDESIAPGVLELGPELQQQGGLQAAGRAELVEENRGGKVRVQDIRVVGRFATTLEGRCARCVEPVRRHLEGEFDLLYRPLGVDAAGDESSISEAETEIGYYSGEGILLEDVLKEQVLLAMPVKQVCSEACRGLCPTCGCNLNHETCQCGERPPDPRWAALEDIRKNLKQ